jgi:hypothetical protein
MRELLPPRPSTIPMALRRLLTTCLAGTLALADLQSPTLVCCPALTSPTPMIARARCGHRALTDP